MTRQEKIILLNSITQGQSYIDLLKAKELSCRFGYADPEFKINGKPVSQETFLTERERQAKAGTNQKPNFSYGPEEPV